MSETTELIAKQIMNGNINKKTWGDILFNVKVYGAAGDGIRDDSAAVQATIDAIATNGGGTVFFPTGRYLIKSTIVIPWQAYQLKLQGSGYSSVLLLGSDTNLISFSLPPSGQALSQTVIEDLHFDGNSRSTGNLVNIVGVSVAYVRGCLFTNIPAAGNGVYINGNGTDYSHENSVIDCYFNTTTGFSAIYLADHAGDVMIHDCQVELRFGCNYAVYIENGTGGLQLNNNHFSNAKINIMKVIGGQMFYRFYNTQFDNALQDLVVIDGSTQFAIYNNFDSCTFAAIPNGFSGVNLLGNASFGVFNTMFDNCLWWALNSSPKSAVTETVKVDQTTILGGSVPQDGIWTTGKFALIGDQTIVKDVFGFNPIGVVTPPANPLVSGTEYTNNYHVPITVYVTAYATTPGTDGRMVASVGKTSASTDVSSVFISGATTNTNPTTCVLNVLPGWKYKFTNTGSTMLAVTIVTND